MRKMHMILNLFAGGHSVTVYKDAGVTTATPSSDSDVQKNADVTLTLVFGTGKKLDEIEVVTGGVTITEDDGTYGFKMGEADVVLKVKSKASNNYIITEDVRVNVNDNPVQLHRNAKLVLTPNGVPSGVSIESGGTVITSNAAAVAELVNQGILIPI